MFLLKYYLPITSVVEPGVGREDQEATGLVAPADVLLAHHSLHDRVEPALRRVQVTRHICASHCTLYNEQTFKDKGTFPPAM